MERTVTRDPRSETNYFIFLFLSVNCDHHCRSYFVWDQNSSLCLSSFISVSKQPIRAE